MGLRATLEQRRLAMQWTFRSAALAVVIGMAVPSSALAVGGPVPPAQGTAIGVPGSASRYRVSGAGGHTIVKRLGADGAPTGAQLRVAGRYGIPGVDYTGAKTGLSANGRTLILAGMQGNGGTPRVTRLLVVSTPRLAIRARIRLPGWSTVDAISPDGRWLYLIHYRSSDISKYEVLAYDLLKGRMLTKPVVDPDDRGEPMTGFPITRVMSTDARWAYTLYMRPAGAPFIHALDTVGRRAVCIDLPSLAATDIGNGHLRLTASGALLHVDIGGVTQALIDTHTLALVTRRAAASHSASASAPRRPTAHRSAARRSGGVPWELLAGLLAVLAALAVLTADPRLARRAGVRRAGRTASRRYRRTSSRRPSP
jgi:hypothetical protein